MSKVNWDIIKLLGNLISVKNTETNTENIYLSQCTPKPTIRLVQTAKIQISLHIYADESESLLIPSVFYSLPAIQRGMNENPCHTGWMYTLIRVFAGHTGLIVDFVVRWLIFKFSYSTFNLCKYWLWIRL